jgi:Cd2+/Zn2+-exporting ATPase
MNSDVIANLAAIGFSEYEAKAYTALLRNNPATGYQVAKASGVPRSMIYEVLGKLTARGAAMTLQAGGTARYSPVPPTEFLDHLLQDHQQLIGSLKDDLSTLASAPDLEYIWNIEGHDNIIARAVEMIQRSRGQAYVALLPATFQMLQPALAEAAQRGVRVRVYTTAMQDLPGGQVVVLASAEQALGPSEGLGLVLVVDGREVLIAEWSPDTQARASWTSSPLLVFVAEHHLRTDLYLPQLLALLGDRALEVIQEEDRELFARALESHIDR